MTGPRDQVAAAEWGAAAVDHTIGHERIARARSSPAPRSERVPSLLDEDFVADKYQLVTQLEEGGMGTLWLAHDLALDVPCALKVIRADIDDDERDYCAQRLLQEARAAARIGHPAIVRVTDAGRTQSGDPFLVMELLDGEDLGRVLERRGRVSAVRAVQVLLPIVDALAAAHEQGIVHRDVKPENVFLARNYDGSVQPKLVDFGVAKLTGGGHALTAAGAVIGTPAYMAPEQVRAESSDGRADVWAICVILYELVTGDQPFAAPTFARLAHAILHEEPRPLAAHPGADAELSAVVMRGLEKDPARRFATMRELGVELAAWLLTLGVECDICGTSLEAQWWAPRSGRLAQDIFEHSFVTRAPPARLSRVFDESASGARPAGSPPAPMPAALAQARPTASGRARSPGVVWGLLLVAVALAVVIACLAA